MRLLTQQPAHVGPQISSTFQPWAQVSLSKSLREECREFAFEARIPLLCFLCWPWRDSVDSISKWTLTKAGRGSGKALEHCIHPPITTFVHLSSCGTILILQVNTSLIMMPFNVYACYCKRTLVLNHIPILMESFPRKNRQFMYMVDRCMPWSLNACWDIFRARINKNPNTATL